MTKEAKKRIAEYMGWKYRRDLWGGIEYFRDRTDGFEQYYIVHFDLNDAGLCVQEIQKQGDWANFFDYVIDTYNDLIDDGKVICGLDNLTAWLFNADNFFTAMSEWLKERGK